MGKPSTKEVHNTTQLRHEQRTCTTYSDNPVHYDPRLRRRGDWNEDSRCKPDRETERPFTGTMWATREPKRRVIREAHYELNSVEDRGALPDSDCRPSSNALQSL